MDTQNNDHTGILSGSNANKTKWARSAIAQECLTVLSEPAGFRSVMAHERIAVLSQPSY
jgi:hypothetical protein